MGQGLGLGAAFAMLLVWVLSRTIGLSEGEITFLGPVLGAIFGGVGAYLAPLFPQQKLSKH